MAEHPFGGGKLGITRNLFAAHFNRVVMGMLRINIETAKTFNDGLGEIGKIAEIFRVMIGDEGKVDIALVMINCTAAGDSAVDRNFVVQKRLVVDLLPWVLVGADHNRSIIDVDNQVVMGGIQIPATMFFQGQIDGRIGDVRVGDEA